MIPIRSEWTKLSTLRATRVQLGIAVVLSPARCVCNETTRLNLLLFVSGYCCRNCPVIAVISSFAC